MRTLLRTLTQVFVGAVAVVMIGFGISLAKLVIEAGARGELDSAVEIIMFLFVSWFLGTVLLGNEIPTWKTLRGKKDQS